jgi:hypothetical protein
MKQGLAQAYFNHLSASFFIKLQNTMQTRTEAIAGGEKGSSESSCSDRRCRVNVTGEHPPALTVPVSCSLGMTFILADRLTKLRAGNCKDHIRRWINLLSQRHPCQIALPGKPSSY